MRLKLRRLFCLDIIDVRTYFLAFFWLSGLMCGLAVAVFFGGDYEELIFSYAAATPSLKALIFSRCIPILLVWFVACYECKRWIYVFCFFQTLIFAYAAALVVSCCASSGWLLWCFMLFSAAGALLPMFWFSLRCLTSDKMQVGDLVVSLTAVLGFVLCDYFVISPFLGSLIKSF